MKLTIVPIAYRGRRFTEIGEKIKEIFHPLITEFDVAPPVELLDLLSCADGDMLIRPNVNGPLMLNGPSLIRYLRNSGKVLAFTSIPAFDLEAGRLWGQAVPETPAFVSPAGGEFGSLDSEEFLQRAVKVAIHEIGHTYRLSHHNGAPRYSKDGKYCPMDYSHFNRVDKGKMTSIEALDAWSYDFCNRCKRKLSL